MNRGANLLLGLVVGVATPPLQAAASIGRESAPFAHTSLPAAAFFTFQSRNAVSGTIFSPSRRPVADIFVELLDDVNYTVGRLKTDASGRFAFGGLASGRYKLRVMPYGTDFLEETQEVVLTSVSAVPGSGSDRQQIDIYLRVNERANTSPFGSSPGVIFAQEVPPAARKLYGQGISYLREKKEKEGLDSLRRALEIFPTYYVALDRLGAEYAMRGLSKRAYMEAGRILLMKAVEVNPRGYSSVFGLGWTQYHLGLTNEAIESLRTATTLYGKGADAHLWLGKALRRAAKLGEAESAFKRANELTEGKSAEVHWQMAALYGDQKRYRESADELELFLKMQPKGKGNEAEVEKVRALIRQLRDKAAASAPATSAKTK